MNLHLTSVICFLLVWLNYSISSDTNKIEQNGLNAKYNFPSTNYCLPNYYNCSGSHNLYVGCVKSWDKILYKRVFHKEGRWWSAREKVIKFPEYSSGHILYDTISGIRIYDRYCNNQGGYASIISGGVGFKNVTIRLYSTGWGKGFSFLVQIFGN